MKALTLKQPWPWAFPLKDIENRVWQPPRQVLGQWIALHGGSVPKNLSLEQLEDYRFILSTTRSLDLESLNALKEKSLRKSFFTGIFAVTQVAGFIDSNRGEIRFDEKLITSAEMGNAEKSPWGFGPVRWVLRNTLMLPEPIKAKGALGLWDVDGFAEGTIRNFLVEKEML